jgi:hypothetical protein
MQSSLEVIESNFLYTILDRVQEAVKSCTATDDPHTGSDATFRLISAWVAECLENHEICRKTQPESTPLPTRVLVDLKMRSKNEDSCVVLNVALRPLYIHQIGDK